MIDSWLKLSAGVTTHGLFGLVNVVEITKSSDDVKNYISEEALKSYRQLEYLKFIFSRRPEQELKDYIRDYVLPSDASVLTRNVRQGDFSEILAGMIVSFFQKRIVPLKKMKWKFNKDRSVFATDMMAHNDGDKISDLYYYEIKSRTTIRKESVDGLYAYVTVHAHNSLAKEQQQPSEAIADFLSRYYFEMDDLANSTKYHDIILNPGNYNKNFELFFIIEKDTFIETILDDLAHLPPAINPLAVTIVLISDLAGLMVEVQNRAMVQAINHVYPKSS